MNQSKNCYSYESIKAINDKLNLNFNDEETRVVQHRLFDFNKLMNILFIEVFENNVIGSKEPFLNNLKQKIYDETKIEINNTELTNLIESLIKNKDECKKVIQPVNQSGGNLGSFGWILPSDNKNGKGVDILSLVLDFIGLVPGAMGNVADIVNFIINIYRGRHFDAGMSFLGLFSYVGLLAPFAKLGWRYYYRPKDEEEGDAEEEEPLADDQDDVDDE